MTPIVRRTLDEARTDPDAFWARAADELPWSRRWDRVFEADPPTFRWFTGGETNLAVNALDRHVEGGNGGHTALICLDERGTERVFTYAQLHHEVVRVAGALRAAGIGRGDRVTIYMPTCAEAIMAMLATVRIGAVHSVVFAGFGPGALGDRIAASGSKLLFTTDATWRKGKTVPLKGIVDAALAGSGPEVERVVVLRRTTDEVQWTSDRDQSWEDFVAAGEGQDGSPVAMESNEPAFILATSGTTARPKLAVHTQGGYQVYIHSQGRWCFGLRPTDVWWSTSDIGWIVGHSYIVYAPLIAGCATIAYEGALDHPGPDRLWQLAAKFGVTGLFTSPTAVRLLMRYGTEVARTHDVPTLERIFCAGEVLNAPAWEWLQREVLKDRVPVIDHMWQTETGGPVFGNPYGLGMLPIKPGSAGIPLPGVDCEVVTPDGTPCAPGEKGIMVLKRPFPGLLASLWNEPERYGTDYWGRLPGRYWTGDSAHIDEDGYVWFAGRADEIIKIAGHRIGTVEVETALLKHPAVAEAGVTGRPDELRGEIISAFAVLRQGHQPSDELRAELIATARRELGPVAVIGDLQFVDLLPKTRSGKIMRRVLKAVVLGQDPGDVTTIEDEGSVEEAREAWSQLRAGLRQEAEVTAPGPTSQTRMTMPDQIDVVAFDAYGTLFDIRSVEAAVSEVTADAEAFTAEWRRAQLEATWLHAAMRTYADFWSVTEKALDRVASAREVKLSAEARGRLMDAWLKVRAHPDVPDALARLSESRRLAIFSNGTPAMLDAAVDANGLRDLFAMLLSVHPLRRYKPDPEVYRWALQELSVGADRLLFVSSNEFDVVGATNAGLTVFSLDRPAMDLSAVVDQIEGRVA